MRGNSLADIQIWCTDGAMKCSGVLVLSDKSYSRATCREGDPIVRALSGTVRAVIWQVVLSVWYMVSSRLHCL
jgi:hypothetical protein